MILQALTDYYNRLVEQGILSAPGWDDAFKVSYGLELGSDGRLLQLVSLKTEQPKGKKMVLLPRSMRVPAHERRTSGIAANFLCDGASYLLGVGGSKSGKDADNGKGAQRAAECFRACAELHEKVLQGAESPAAKAVLAFFAQWEPTQAAENPVLTDNPEAWAEVRDSANLIFFYNGTEVTKDAEIASAWQRHYNAVDENAVMGQCLITGEYSPIAQTHPAIKGVKDAQSSGAALVSFNAPAFESYGHTQGANAPIGTQAAFAYTTALNYLLSGPNRKIVGDTTIVCWAESGQSGYQDAVMAMLMGDMSDEGVSENALQGVLESIAHGSPIEWKDELLLPGEHFYVLGISPNAARLSVRFFLRDTFGGFAKNIAQHYRDIEIVRPDFDKDEALPLWKLLGATVNQNSRNKAASPQLAGAMLYAILSGTPYPATLLNGAELRIRAEQSVTRARAAILKGYYLRLPHTTFPKEILTMELQQSSTNVPYLLGRLFAVYERIQSEANPNIKATIRDRFFNSASATPAHIFPLLCNLSQSHQKVLGRGNKGRLVNLEKLLMELSAGIGTAYPARLTLPEQGAFQLGYYHQVQSFYTKKENKQEEC